MGGYNYVAEKKPPNSTTLSLARAIAVIASALLAVGVATVGFHNTALAEEEAEKQLRVEYFSHVENTFDELYANEDIRLSKDGEELVGTLGTDTNVDLVAGDATYVLYYWDDVRYPIDEGDFSVNSKTGEIRINGKYAQSELQLEVTTNVSKPIARLLAMATGSPLVAQASAITTQVASSAWITYKGDGAIYKNGNQGEYHTWKRVVTDSKGLGFDDAEDRYVYCIEPYLNSAGDGTKLEIATMLDDDASGKMGKFRKILYYSLGFKGYSKGGGKEVWNKYGFDTKDWVYMAVHYALSEYYAKDSHRWDNVDTGVKDRVLKAAAEILSDLEDPPDGFIAYVATPSGNRQDMAGGGYESTGEAAVKKVSATPSMTKDNSNYSLEGAVYRIYSDKECTEAVAKITTDKNGEGSTDIPAGTYWVKETKASPGYDKDENVQKITVKSGETTTFTSKEPPKPVTVALKKQSANPSISNGNGCYSIDGAVYTVYRDSSLSTVAGTITVKGGTGKLEGLAAGTYWIKETSRPKGFKLDGTRYSLTLAPGEEKSFTSKEVPLSDPIDLLLQKMDKDTGLADPQGNGTLQDAEFTIRYYDGNYATAGALPAKAKNEWVVKTNGQGKIEWDNPVKGSGDDFYRDGDDKIVFPLGTVAVTESKAPTGYHLETVDDVSATYILLIQDDGSAQGDIRRDNTNFVQVNNARAVEDVVLRGDFRLVKEANTEVNPDKPQEDKRVVLEGVRFDIVNESAHAVLSPEDGKTLVEPGGVVCTIITDANGLATTNRRSMDGPKADLGEMAVNGWAIPDGWTAALAYGEYSVNEIIPDEVQEKFFEEYGRHLIPIKDGAIKFVVDSEGRYDGPDLVDNKIAQTPLKILKVDAETGKKIPLMVSFKLKDAEGNYVKHTYHSPVEQTVDTYTSTEDGELTLPMLLLEGTYYLCEAQAPEGYALNGEELAFTVESDEYRTWADPIEVTFEDTPIKGKIRIQKYDSDTREAVPGAQYMVAAAEDIVTPEGTVRLEKGELAATVATDEDGIAETGELYLGYYKVYEAKSPEGWALDTEEHFVTISSQGQDVPVVTVGVDYYDHPSKLRVVKTDSKTEGPLANAKFRVWADVDAASSEVDWNAFAEGLPEALEAASASIEDEDNFKANLLAAPAGEKLGFTVQAAKDNLVKQVLLVAEKDEANNLLVTYASEAEASFMGDVMSVPALVPESDGGTEWELVTNDKGVAELPYLKWGSYWIEETEAPEGYHMAEGTSPVKFTVNEQGFVGVDGGDFLDTYTHAVANVPNEIGTTATVDGAKSAKPSEKVTLVDTVAYSGATVGKTYTVTGTLHIAVKDEEGNIVDGGEATDPSGNAITASTEFTAEAVDGEVDVVFTFDASGLAGKTLVAFEVMEGEFGVFATHEDITDEGQTVVIEPDAKTTLTDEKTKNHTARVSGKTTVVDTVAYKGLVPGIEYKALGVLVGKDTRQPLLNENGTQVSAEMTFTPEAPDGTFDMVFTFDASALAGTSAVAFETISTIDPEALVVYHADIEDEEQTVTFPTARTTAKDGDDGDSTIKPDGKATIVDTVEYTGLTPGQEYTVVGTLHVVTKGGEDGGALKDAKGKEVTASTTFTPDEPDGSVEVKFTFDASELDGRSLVVFEKVNQTGKNIATGEEDENVTVVTHEDITDKGQTVEVSEHPTKPTPAPSNPTNPSTPSSTPTPSGSGFGKTGDVLGQYWWALLAAMAAACAAGAYGLRQRRLAKAGSADAGSAAMAEGNGNAPAGTSGDASSPAEDEGASPSEAPDAEGGPADGGADEAAEGKSTED